MIENIKKIQNLLKLNNKKVWVMYNNSNSDRFFVKYINENFATSSYLIISQTSCYILVHDLDKNNIKKYDEAVVKIFIYSNILELTQFLEDILAELNFETEILLSYSTMSDLNIDVLSYGLYINLTKKLKQLYFKFNKKIKFASAEKIMYELESQKSTLEISRLKLIAEITSNILKETFNQLKVGMTEIEISKLTKKVTRSIMKYECGKNNIKSYKFAWEVCPIVLTGENLAKGGHSLPSNKKLKKAETVYFDFGITVKFTDNMVLSTDMQRMGYVLDDNEIKPPKAVQKVFDTLVNSIEDGMDEMKPGIKAYKIDKIVRDAILKQGYPNYNHATGHPVGRLVHDVGAIISLKLSKLARLELVEDGVYTLEPRVNIPNGGSIEEMIMVTKFGGIPLCEPQKEIYLIK